MDLVDLLEPEVLMHPNIPKPLHEVNPRNIMGRVAWDELRQEVYASLAYHCIACGVHKSEAKGPKWLEAHEFYHIDYEKARVEIEKIIPLCHYCHAFIHSGRLKMVIQTPADQQEAVDILEHGFEILADNNLKAFYPTILFAQELNANTFGVQEYHIKSEPTKWEDWRLVWEGKEYPPKFETYEAWQKHFGR